MVHTTPTKALLPTTLRPLVVQLSGPLAQGVRLVEQFLLDEPEAAEFAQLIEDDLAPLISAASVLEAGIVLISRHGLEARGDLQDFLEQGGLQVEPVTAEQAELALDAYQRYGKGRHRAGLNFGDCFAYALCKATGQPLLFKGQDFSLTDIATVPRIRGEDEHT
jgi:ribonuclease VapC